MQTSPMIRAIAVSLSIALVAAALIGATWYQGGAGEPANTMLSVPTGEFVDGIPVHRLPSITVTASRNVEMAKMAREEAR